MVSLLVCIQVQLEYGCAQDQGISPQVLAQFLLVSDRDILSYEIK